MNLIQKYFNKWKQCLYYKNQTDLYGEPFSSQSNIFYIISSSNSIYRFIPEQLYQHFYSTQKFTNPYNQNVLLTPELRRFARQMQFESYDAFMDQVHNKMAIDIHNQQKELDCDVIENEITNILQRYIYAIYIDDMYINYADYILSPYTSTLYRMIITIISYLKQFHKLNPRRYLHFLCTQLFIIQLHYSYFCLEYDYCYANLSTCKIFMQYMYELAPLANAPVIEQTIRKTALSPLSFYNHLHERYNEEYPFIQYLSHTKIEEKIRVLVP